MPADNLPLGLIYQALPIQCLRRCSSSGGTRCIQVDNLGLQIPDMHAAPAVPAAALAQQPVAGINGAIGSHGRALCGCEARASGGQALWLHSITRYASHHTSHISIVFPAHVPGGRSQLQRVVCVARMESAPHAKALRTAQT